MHKNEIRDEVLACGRDPSYFMRHVKISHPTRGLIPFKMFDYQEKLVKDYMRHRFNVILKARQLGISEVTAAFAAWLMLFHRQKNILVMATKAATAKNIVKKVRTALKKIPTWLMLSEIVIDNVMSIELDNGSVIKAITTSEDAGRSEALSLLIIDEAAFVRNLDDIWTGLFPTVSAGGRVIVLSTPNGVGNKFHQLYTEACEGQNEFYPTMLMWWEHPERISDLVDDLGTMGGKTSSWFRNEIRSTNMSDRDVAQELCCNFNASGETVIASHLIAEVERETIDPVAMQGWDRNVHIWWHPQKDKRYFISADVARGDGKDNSAAIVFDMSTLEEQAEYYGKESPEDFANTLMELGKLYNTALLVVENNNVGLVCLEHIRMKGYENVYYSRKGDSRPGEIVNTHWGTSTDDLIPGFTTSGKTRPLMITKLEEHIRNKTVIFRSRRFHSELKTFVWTNGRPEAMRGHKDDLIMAAAVGLWIKDTFLAANMNSADVARKLLMGISTESTKNTSIAGASKDPRYARISMGMNSQRAHPLEVRLPGGGTIDFKWLLPISKG